MSAPQPALGAFPPAVVTSLDGNVTSRRQANVALCRRLHYRTRGRRLPKAERRRLSGHSRSSGRERPLAGGSPAIARREDIRAGVPLAAGNGSEGVGKQAL